MKRVSRGSFLIRFGIICRLFSRRIRHQLEVRRMPSHSSKQHLPPPPHASGSSHAFEYADNNSESYFRSVRKNRKAATCIMIAITIVISVMIIGVFLAVLMRFMTSKTEDKFGGLGKTFNGFIKNATDFIHQTFPPNHHHGNDTDHHNRSDHPFHIFGEGSGQNFDLKHLLTITGEVIKQVNQSAHKKEEDKKDLYHVN